MELRQMAVVTGRMRQNKRRGGSDIQLKCEHQHGTCSGAHLVLTNKHDIVR